MKVTGDQQLIKKMNKGIVLDIIMQQQPLSRADIASVTGLNKATVSSLVSELLDSQLVTEIGPGQSSGGRKPTLLLFNRHAGYSIGIDIRVHDLLMLLVDLEGHVVKEKSIPLTDITPENVMILINKQVNLLSKKAPPSPYGIIGIGIGVPGLVDEHSKVISSPNLGWSQLLIRDILKSDSNGGFHIDNEANAGAIGEKLYGAGIHSPNMIYISIGVGIGSGIIMNGELYRGTSNFAGEVGHMTIAQDGLLCRCGNTGCWETLASEKAILDQATELWGHPFTSVNDIISLAKAGDEQALTLFHNLGANLGIGLANLINILNPELIVIGGSLSCAADLIQDTMLQTIQNRSLSYHHEKNEVRFAGLGLQSAALGAASLPISSFLANPDSVPPDGGTKV